MQFSLRSVPGARLTQINGARAPPPHSDTDAAPGSSLAHDDASPVTGSNEE
ncbi:hypothetical protein BDSB_28685 [Burkholderia dolosa PC543]|nr:hypothetical protein BDSB_28685 [Burkholderia dolosa PC543]